MGRPTKDGKNLNFKKTFESVKALDKFLLKNKLSIRWTKSESRNNCKVCKRAGLVL